MGRLLIWKGTEEWLAEAASVELTPSGIRASGTQLGSDPVPYRLDYELDAAEGCVTRVLEVEASGAGWKRRLTLGRGRSGRWDCQASGEGEIALPPAGGDLGGLGDAVDCDLAGSPLTNFMPIRRLGFAEPRAAVDLVMAWVSVPDLGVRPYRQRYEHVRATGDGAVVRFVSLDPDAGFSSELELDVDGLVRVYPGLAERVGV